MIQHEGSQNGHKMSLDNARPKLKPPRSVPKTDSAKVMEIGWTVIQTGVKSEVFSTVKRYESIRLIEIEVPSSLWFTQIVSLLVEMPSRV